MHCFEDASLIYSASCCPQPKFSYKVNIQEKIVASCAKQCIIVRDEWKESHKLRGKDGRGIRVEVIPIAYCPLQQKIEAELRIGKLKVGSLVTDNGNFILDWKFPALDFDWASVNTASKVIPGMYIFVY